MPSRRAFLSSALLIPGLSHRRVQAHRVSYEDILGTSMELTVWTRHAGAPATAAAAALCEIRRLEALLSTYRRDSEISRFGRALRSAGSVERASLLDRYDDWRGWTGGVITSEIGGRLNVDALGKSFIVDRVVAHLHRTISELDGIVLNIGGDVAVSGRAATVNVIDPRRPAENDDPIARLSITDRAVATSGSYARAGHLIDPRTGQKANGALAATVIALDCTTANALATALCVLAPEDGLALVERTAGAESLVITASGTERRSSGFAAYEQARPAPATVAAGWPAGYDVRIALTLTGPGTSGSSDGRGRGRGRGSYRSPYVAVWADDTRGRPIRTIAVWGDKWRYLGELPDWWSFAKNDSALNTTATRATRPAGQYTIVWNGLDDKGAPVPAGSYRLNLEVSREHGTYARRAGVIACASAPATVTLSESVEFAPVTIAYGPRPAPTW